MDKENLIYTVTELLENEYFIESMLSPAKESELFWKELISEGKIDIRDFEEAKQIIQLFHYDYPEIPQTYKNQLWSQIEIKNKLILTNKIKKLHKFIISSVASILIIGSLLFTHYQYKGLENDTPELFLSDFFTSQIPDNEDITLILADHEVININEQNAEISHLEDEKITVNDQVIHKENPQKKEVKMNQLIVPKGYGSQLTLADGTTVWVNSGTKIIYPQEFNDKERTIYVNGEVYMDVAKDEHKPFIVKTDKMDIRVLGTSFNISAYHEDSFRELVLISGSVSIQTQDKEYKLLPNQAIVLENDICKIEEVNPEKYIAWKKGYMICENEKLSSISTRLERYYGKKIILSDEITSLRCNGKLDMNRELEMLLSDIQDVLNIKFEKTINAFHIYKPDY